MSSIAIAVPEIDICILIITYVTLALHCLVTASAHRAEDRVKMLEPANAALTRDLQVHRNLVREANTVQVDEPVTLLQLSAC
jgi:predicted nucleotidyltransferase